MEYACAEIYKILGDQIQRELDTSDFVSTFLFFVSHLNDHMDMTRLCVFTVLSLAFFFSISFKRESLEFCWERVLMSTKTEYDLLDRAESMMSMEEFNAKV